MIGSLAIEFPNVNDVRSSIHLYDLFKIEFTNLLIPTISRQVIRERHLETFHRSEREYPSASTPKLTRKIANRPRGFSGQPIRSGEFPLKWVVRRVSLSDKGETITSCFDGSSTTDLCTWQSPVYIFSLYNNKKINEVTCSGEQKIETNLLVDTVAAGNFSNIPNDKFRTISHTLYVQHTTNIPQIIHGKVTNYVLHPRQRN